MNNDTHPQQNWNIQTITIGKFLCIQGTKKLFFVILHSAQFLLEENTDDDDDDQCRPAANAAESSFLCCCHCLTDNIILGWRDRGRVMET